ncbi:MAG: hypothetical protein IJD88_00630 [Clostridia bacterium]|nr:hypothetical protein [Clostridia bacterium]
MELKPSKLCYTYVIMLLVCTILICFAFLEQKFGFIATAIPVCFLLLFTIRFWITYGRTLIMDEEGCTVKFLCFRRKYKWTELKTKRVEDYTRALRYREPFTGGVIFCKKRTRKPKWLTPSNHCMLVHPFSFFFVYFDPHTNVPEGSYHYQIKAYVVEKEKFLKQMKEWNVDLENAYECD